MATPDNSQCLGLTETAEGPSISSSAALDGAPRDLAQETSTPLGPDDKGEDNAVLVVDWDDSGDPKNPKNWSLMRRWAATAIVSCITFIAFVVSSIVAPAGIQLGDELGICDDVAVAFVTSIYMLAYAFGSLFFAPVSEIYGRSRVLQLANLSFLAWNLACGFAQDESQLLVFRFLSGLCGSAFFVIGGGLLGDCWHAEERGRAVALFGLAPILGLVIGAIAGAWIAEYVTWRWVFWSTSIIDAVLALGLFYLQETYAPLLLQRKAENIQRSMDAEKSIHKEVRTTFSGQDRSWRVIMMKALVRPFTLFVQEPIIQLLSLYLAFVYGIMFLFVTSIPSIFVGVYQQPLGIAGLHYIALGLGMFVASQVNARTLDSMYTYLKNKNGGIGHPEFRLPGMFIGTVALPIGLLITGWSAKVHTHWIVPDIGLLLVGGGIMFHWVCIQAYIIDAFTLHAASAMAAATFLWSLAGCGFPLLAPAMYGALGFGVGDTVLAVVAVVVGCFAPLIFWYFGPRMRRHGR